MTMLNDALMVSGLQLTSPITSSLVGRLYNEIATLVPLDELRRSTTS